MATKATAARATVFRELFNRSATERLGSQFLRRGHLKYVQFAKVISIPSWLRGSPLIWRIGAAQQNG
jgi:hypothetical protein